MLGVSPTHLGSGNWESLSHQEGRGGLVSDWCSAVRYPQHKNNITFQPPTIRKTRFRYTNELNKKNTASNSIEQNIGVSVHVLEARKASVKKTYKALAGGLFGGSVVQCTKGL